MKFLDFNKSNIIQNSVLTDDGYYEYTLGSQVEITTIKSTHSNNLMAQNLSSNVKDDKLMIKYQPTNKVLFSKNFIDSDIDGFFASCYIDKDTNRVYIGTPNEFGINSGILAFSGYLSLNNLVEEDRKVLCNKRFEKTIWGRIRVLSIGVRGDKLYGLWYIPSVKGIALGIRECVSKGISPTTMKIADCTDYLSFSIKDWFKSAKIREL